MGSTNMTDSTNINDTTNMRDNITDITTFQASTPITDITIITEVTNTADSTNITDITKITVITNIADSTNITDILGNLDTPDMATFMSALEPAEFRFKFSGLGEFDIILRSVSFFRSNCESSYFWGKKELIRAIFANNVSRETASLKL